VDAEVDTIFQEYDANKSANATEMQLHCSRRCSVNPNLGLFVGNVSMSDL
jgi:hypothetical protein